MSATDPPQDSSPHLARATAAVFLAAAIVHVVVWLQYRADPFSLTYVADALSYHGWASRIATGGLAAEPVFHQSPLFPLVLSLVYRIAPEPTRAVSAIGLQILLTSAALALLVPLGRRWLGSTSSGVASALLALLHGPFVFYSMKLLPGPLALVTQAGGLAALGLAHASRRIAPAALAGACWGLACLARSEMLLFAPMALVALVQRRNRSGPRRLGPAVAYAAALALVIAPATVHNARQGGPVLVASAAGENLFIGNQRGAEGGYRALHAAAGDIFSQRVAAQTLAERERGRPLRPSEISAYWRGRALDEIREAPGAWLALEGRKLARLLHPGDPTDLYSYSLERARYLTALHALVATPWVLLGLGLAGLGLARRAWPVAGLAGVHLVVLMIFFVDTRLRLPLLFALCPFAGHAVVEGVRRWRAGRRRLPLALAALTLLSIAVGQLATRATPRDLVRLASTLSVQNRLDESLAVLDEDLSRPEPHPRVLDQAGWVLQKKQDHAAAAERYVQAIAAGLDPANERQTRTRLAQVLERLQRFDEAAIEHDLAVSSGHANAGTYFERGMFRLRRGDLDGAVRDLEHASRLDPRWPAPRAALRTLRDAQR